MSTFNLCVLLLVGLSAVNVLGQVPGSSTGAWLPVKDVMTWFAGSLTAFATNFNEKNDKAVRDADRKVQSIKNSLETSYGQYRNVSFDLYYSVITGEYQKHGQPCKKLVDSFKRMTAAAHEELESCTKALINSAELYKTAISKAQQLAKSKIAAYKIKVKGCTSTAPTDLKSGLMALKCIIAVAYEASMDVANIDTGADVHSLLQLEIMEGEVKGRFASCLSGPLMKAFDRLTLLYIPIDIKKCSK